MPFQVFSSVHLAAIVGCILALVALILYLRTPKSPANRRRDIWVFTLAFLLIEAALVGSKIAAGHWDMRYNLPLHLCDFSAFAILFALHTRNERVFEWSYYWGITGGLLGILLPNLESVNWYFIPFFIWHLFLIAGPLYQRRTDVFLLPYKSVWSAWGTVLVLATLMHFINRAINGNYMFVNEKIPQFDAIGLPDYPVYLPVVAAVALGVFHVIWMLSKKD